MWRENLSKDTAINFLKERRKCVEINIGFLYQLNKWEELNKSKENKIFIMKENGNISLFELNEQFEHIFGKNICFVLILFNDKLYKFTNKSFEVADKFGTKLAKFTNLLKLHKCFNIEIQSNIKKDKFLNEQNFKVRFLIENNFI